MDAFLTFPIWVSGDALMFSGVETLLNFWSFDISLRNKLFVSFLKLFIYLIKLKTYLYLVTYLFLFLTYLFL